MSNTPQKCVAIYDEIPLTKSTLPTTLCRLGFEVLFTCGNTNELLKNLSRKTKVLLMHADCMKGKMPLIKKVKQKFPSIKIIVYCSQMPDAVHTHFINEGADRVISSHDSINGIVDALDDIFSENNLPIYNGKSSMALSASDPFFSITHDQKKLSILELCSQGKSVDEITDLTGYPSNTVKTYKARIIHDTHSKNFIEVIAKAKDKKII